jgi:predicted NAD/FAD-dependent oxidoreductase
MSKLNDTIIIGAGLSGLYLYQELKSKGKNVLVLEKSRNIGGRIAQRRFDGHTFEMGAENYPDVPLEQWRSLILKNKGIRKQSLVEKVGIQNHIIQVHADKLFKAKTVVICAPAPQAFQLLRKSGLALYELNNVNYSMDIFYFTKIVRGYSQILIRS